jgi:hypothetical protein
VGEGTPRVEGEFTPCHLEPRPDAGVRGRRRIDPILGDRDDDDRLASDPGDQAMGLLMMGSRSAASAARVYLRDIDGPSRKLDLNRAHVEVTPITRMPPFCPIYFFTWLDRDRIGSIIDASILPVCRSKKDRGERSPEIGGSRSGARSPT